MNELLPTGPASLFLTICTLLVLMFFFFGGVSRLGKYLEERNKNSEKGENQDLTKISQGIYTADESALLSSGFRLAINQIGPVIAVVTHHDYQKCLATALAMGDKGLGDNRPWSKLRLRITPTYTFSENFDDRRPAHTGTKQDLLKMLRVAFGRILDHSMDAYSDKQIEYLFGFICVRDKRIHVPFAGDTRDVNARDWSEYRDITLANFLAEVVETVPRKQKE